MERAPKVAVVIQYTSKVGSDDYDEVVRKIQFHDDPPPGLVLHAAAITDDGQMRIYDVWSSREAHDRFVENRLGPAIAEVVGDGYEADVQVHELHSLVQPLEESRFGSGPRRMEPS